ncbi:recombinase family protein [uncultured Hymenobacter sp.]|uniref:recombinase family protein n=1 Tax=uncultured Hymenobacter sp. TaxID=170016 RepID=UPI0035CC6927
MPLRRDGLTFAAIAEELNAHGYRTRRGYWFRKATVLRLLRLEIPPASLQESEIAEDAN